MPSLCQNLVFKLWSVPILGLLKRVQNLMQVIIPSLYAWDFRLTVLNHEEIPTSNTDFSKSYTDVPETRKFRLQLVSKELAMKTLPSIANLV